MKQKLLTVFLFLIVISLCTSKVPSQAKTPNLAELEKTITDELKEKNAVGAAVAVIKDDKIVFAKGFGTANYETNAPITPETLFQVGSMTKTFTAEMILQLAEEDKVKLESPIGVYAKTLSPKLSKMTLAQLLSHTSGIIDEPDEFGAADESLMAAYIRSWKDNYALFNAGDIFSYSNSGFALAGFTAQEAVGKSYIEIMNEKVFQPFGMKSSTFRPTVAMTYPLAVGHTVKPNENPQVVRPLPQDARLYPAGTFYSNLNDLSRFAIAFLNSGKVDGKQLILPSVIEKMSTPHARQLSAADDTSYGYGLFMNTDRGVRQIWHDGTMTGYVALMKFIPEQKFALIILGNTNNIGFIKTHDKALEMFVNLKSKEDFKAKPALPMSEVEMKKYTGSYSQPNRWTSEVFIRDGKLFIKQFNRELELTKIGENRFSFQFPNAPRPLEIFIQPEENGRSGFLHQYVWAFKKIG